MATAQDARAMLDDDQIEDLVIQQADSFAKQGTIRAPVLHTPAEVGVDFETVSFPSLDGVPLEGWFIPRAGSDKLIIANHAKGFSRSGQPTNLDPWKSVWGGVADGRNEVEVNFVPDLKILHEAGYNVLTYDFRNHGLSGAAQGGMGTNGLYELRDVVGSVRYARSRDDTRDMVTGLFSRCLGCASTFGAIATSPRDFDGVRCLVGVLPVTEAVITSHQFALKGVPVDRLDGAMAEFDRQLRLRTSVGLDDRSPREWTKHVNLPTFLYGVYDDVLTDPEDLQTMFDNLPATEKQLHWVTGTPARWDGYLEFQRRPEPMLDWFERFMG